MWFFFFSTSSSYITLKFLWMVRSMHEQEDNENCWVFKS